MYDTICVFTYLLKIKEKGKEASTGLEIIFDLTVVVNFTTQELN